VEQSVTSFLGVPNLAAGSGQAAATFFQDWQLLDYLVGMSSDTMCSNAGSVIFHKGCSISNEKNIETIDQFST